jgi:hypothetical protein
MFESEFVWIKEPILRLTNSQLPFYYAIAFLGRWKKNCFKNKLVFWWRCNSRLSIGSSNPKLLYKCNARPFQGQTNVGQMSIKCRTNVGQMLNKHCTNVGQTLDKGQTKVGQRSDKGRTNVGQMLDKRRTNVGQRSNPIVSSDKFAANKYSRAVRNTTKPLSSSFFQSHFLPFLLITASFVPEAPFTLKRFHLLRSRGPMLRF